MVSSDQGPLGMRPEPLSTMLIRIIISAFTILTAFNIRDVISQAVAIYAPETAVGKLTFTTAIAALFLFLTCLFAYIWQDEMNA